MGEIAAALTTVATAAAESATTAASAAAPIGVEDIRAIRALLNSSQNHLAFESAQRLLREPIADAAVEVQLRYLAALAAARGGARNVAQGMLAALTSHNIADTKLAADIESLSGRLAKDVAFDARNGATRRAVAKDAAASYLRADAIHPNVYAKINAASLAAIAGDDAAARALVQSVLEGLPASTEDDHWTHATRGEAKLLLDDVAGAVESYTQARKLAGDRFGDIASMRRQLVMLQHVRPAASQLLAVVSGPNVVAFSGHMIDAPSRATPRFPAYLEDAVKAQVEREMEDLLPVIAYAQAANGSDMLFCEALLARGQEVNIVLPFGREDYVAQSVAPGGADWLARFDHVLAKASSVTYATDGLYLGDDSLFQHASELIQGLASLRAQSLTVTPTMLVVADTSQAGATGGTLATLATWERRGHPYRVVDLKTTRDATPPPANHTAVTLPAAAKQEPLAGGRHIKSLLFADVKGFSKLLEQHAPGFFTAFLGAVPKVLAAHNIEPLEMSSRGDGLYMVFGSTEEAARFSWELSKAMGAIDWSSLNLPTDTHVRIALHAGPVFIATDPVNRTLAHYGSHVTRAARVEPIVVPGQILVTEPFAAVLAAQAASAFVCDLVGIEPLAKGYGESRLYRLRLA
jgi:class 3 adenylate cyclase